MGFSLDFERQHYYGAADFGVLRVQGPSPLDAVEDADCHRLDEVFADALSVNGPLAVGLVAQHLDHLLFGARVAQLLVGVMPVVT